MAFELDNVSPSSRPLSQAGDQYRDLKRLGFVVRFLDWFMYVRQLRSVNNLQILIEPGLMESRRNHQIFFTEKKCLTSMDKW